MGSTSKITFKAARDKAESPMEAMTTNQVVLAEQLQKERRAKKLELKDVEAKKTFADLADEFVYKMKVPGWKNSQGIYSVLWCLGFS